MAQKEDFYHELDKKGKRSFCTCQTLALLFLVLAIFAVVGIVVAVKKVTTVIQPSRHVATTSQTTTELQQKFQELSKAPGASTNLRITEAELTSLLIQGISNQSKVTLRNVQAEIHSDRIVLTATSAELFQSTVTIDIVPSVVEGRLTLESSKIQAGTLPIPAAFTKTISEGLNELINKQLSEQQNVMLKSIDLADGYMDASGVIDPNSTPSPS